MAIVRRRFLKIAAGALGSSDLPVPFYHRANGNFRRDLIRADAQS